MLVPISRQRTIQAGRVCVLLSLAVASGFADQRMRAYPDHVFQKYIPGILDHSYGAPAIYRVLMPYGLTYLANSTGWTLPALWLATRLLAFLLAYLAIDRYLRTWFSSGEALTGVAVVAATIPLTFTNSWAHPDAIPELAFFALGCYAAVNRRDVLFAVTLAVASLNRETSGLLLLVYLVAQPWCRQTAYKLAVFGTIWSAVYMGLRWSIGWQPYEVWQLGKNLEFLKLLPPAYDPYYRSYAWFGLLLFGPMYLLASLVPPGTPPVVRRLLWVVPPFAVVCVLFSSIIESRIFTPVYPLVLPGLMFTLLRADTSKSAV